MEERVSVLGLLPAKLNELQQQVLQLGAELRMEISASRDGVRTDINRQFAELREEMGRQFEAVGRQSEGMNRRFEAMDRRFESVDRRFESLDQKMDRHLMWLIGTQLGLLLAIVGALVSAYSR
jgi:hypothetical protein